MSKPRYNWWGFALAIIRDYPMRAKALKELREQKLNAELSDMPKSETIGRMVENLATVQLHPQEQREHDAVYMAMLRTKVMQEGKLRMDVVRLSILKGYTIDSTAVMLHVSERTARRYRWQFVLLVGHMYGFLDEEAYLAAVKKDAPR